jgi:tetratricopeptide (TPR) repeat protein
VRRPPLLAAVAATGASAAAAAACEDKGSWTRRTASDTAIDFAKADAIFDAADYTSLVACLRAMRPQDDAQLLWRLGRALKKLGDAEKDKKAKEALVREGLACAERALKLDASCGAAHKWFAILLSESGSFGSTKESIKNSFVVREHFEQAVSLSPDDATSRHLLGLWCFEVAKLSWIEQKVAAAIFASPPRATFEEAIGHFLAAEGMDPGFYPKNLLLLAQAHARLGRKDEAKEWLGRCLAATPRSPEDEATLAEAKKLQLS